MAKILVACEQEIEGQLLDQALTERGYTVASARDGVAALDLLRATTPALVLANIMLPKLDGFVLLRKCLQDELLQRLPFVFFSNTQDNPKYADYALNLGAKRFVAGTNDLQQIVQAVEEVLATVTQPEPSCSTQPTVAQAVVECAADIPVTQTPFAVTNAVSWRSTATAVQPDPLFAHNPACMWVIDPVKSRVLEVNAAALALYGCTRAEFLSLNVATLMGDIRSEVSSITHTIQYTRKDGQTLSLYLLLQDITFAGRAATLVVAVDIGVRVRAERRMIEELKRLRSVTTTLTEGYCVLAANGRILDANERCCQLTGYARAELLQRHIADLHPHALLTTLLSRPTGAVMLRHKDGTQWLAQVRIAALNATTYVYFMRQQQTRQSRLPLVLAVQSCMDRNDEVVMQRECVTLMAQAFNSPVALFGWLNQDTHTLTLQAVSINGTSATVAAESVLLPVGWEQWCTVDAVRMAHEVTTSWALPHVGALHHYLVACVHTASERMGLFLVANREAVYHGQEQTEFLEIAQIAIGLLAHAHIHAAVLTAVQRADRTGQSMVDLLCRLIDQHEWVAAGSLRVAALAVSMARIMGLDEDQQRVVHLAARLHDIGNITLPREILTRPTALSEYEMALVKTHVVQGVKLLQEIYLDDAGAVADAVHQHHERLDGSGYPQGLKGAQIALPARILAVADVVEAMCSARAQRQALGVQEALAEITAGSGTLYDQAAVTACIQLFQTGGVRWIH